MEKARQRNIFVGFDKKSNLLKEISDDLTIKSSREELEEGFSVCSGYHLPFRGRSFKPEEYVLIEEPKIHCYGDDDYSRTYIDLLNMFSQEWFKEIRANYNSPTADLLLLSNVGIFNNLTYGMSVTPLKKI